MKMSNDVRTIAILLSLLVISLPVVLAAEYDLVWDANGNLVYDGKTDIYREYNELNQLYRTRLNNSTGIVLQEYTYDPIKERVFIKDEFNADGSLKSSTYYFDDDFIVLKNSSGTFNRTNIYQDGVLVGYQDFDNRKYYVLPDHEGGAHIVLNESGEVIEENLFSPFAEPLTGVVQNKFSYEDKEYDHTVKDYDFHFRKYIPDVGFGQGDTLIQNVYDPQSLNRYAFERNNPYKYVDPDGHQSEGVLNAVRRVGLPGLIISVLIMTAYFIGTGTDRDRDQTMHNDKIVQQVDANIANQEITEERRTEEHFPPTPKTTDGTLVPKDAEEERQNLQCYSESINCEKDSRLKLKMDPTIQQDTPTPGTSKKDESKTTSSPGSGGNSGSGGNPGYWATCTQSCTTTTVNGNSVITCKWVCTTH